MGSVGTDHGDAQAVDEDSNDMTVVLVAASDRLEATPMGRGDETAGALSVSEAPLSRPG